MKTADRILLVALDLFNRQGASQVSSVDIALELDISPGNLYYHFKGKEILVKALFERYRLQLRKILQAPSEHQLTVEEFFYYLFLIFECSHHYRFLYRNTADLIESFPELAHGVRQLLKEKDKVIGQVINQFIVQGDLVTKLEQQKYIVDLISMITTQATNHHLLMGDDINQGQYIQSSLASILFALAPYLNVSKPAFLDLHRSIALQKLDNT